MCRPESGTLPSPPSAEDRQRVVDLKRSFLWEVEKMPDKTQDDVGRQIAKLAIAGVRVPDIWREGLFAQRMFVKGVIAGGLHVANHPRSGGIA